MICRKCYVRSALPVSESVVHIKILMHLIPIGSPAPACHQLPKEEVRTHQPAPAEEEDQVNGFAIGRCVVGDGSVSIDFVFDGKRGIKAIVLVQKSVCRNLHISQESTRSMSFTYFPITAPSMW
jgi:hypothetical protein